MMRLAPTGNNNTSCFWRKGVMCVIALRVLYLDSRSYIC